MKKRSIKKSVLAVGMAAVCVLSNPPIMTFANSQKVNQINSQNQAGKSGYMITSPQQFEETILGFVRAVEPKIVLYVDAKKVSIEQISHIMKNLDNRKEVTWSVDSIAHSYVVTNSGLGVFMADINFHTNKDTEIKVGNYINQWVAYYIKPEMPVEERVRIIHDYIVANFRYNEGDANSKSGGYSIFVPGSLIMGQGGVCQSYAAIFYQMAVASGIEVKYVTGTAWQNEGEKIPHAWNMVKIQDKWYHIDTTWDDPVPEVKGRIIYRYYLKGDEYMKKSRVWDTTRFPKANENYPVQYQTLYWDIE